MATVVLVLLVLSPLLSGAVVREAAAAGIKLNLVSTQLCSASKKLCGGYVRKLEKTMTMAAAAAAEQQQLTQWDEQQSR